MTERNEQMFKFTSLTTRAIGLVSASVAAAALYFGGGGLGAAEAAGVPAQATTVLHKTVTVDGLDIFYREAGRKDAPTILLLHGFPTSSQMFRNLIPALADRFHLVAPDYPGFGNSSMPTVDEFDYTFDRLAEVVDAFTRKLGLERYSLYVMDYGAPVGFRLAARHPERVQALIVQNGNAYAEGLGEFWDPFRAYWKNRTEENAKPLKGFLNLQATKWQWTHGTRDARAVSPDTWTVDQSRLDRPGNADIQLRLFFDYGSNPALYPAWQAYFRAHQPPTLVVWGKNDHIFPAAGAHPYKRDLETIEVHLLDTGHFALEEDGGLIAGLIRRFLGAHIG
jgi:pimeloyl-ACP methyl ester carboxylesterase